MTYADHWRSEMMRDRWREVAGLPARQKGRLLPDPDVLAATEWSPAFERHMRDRLICGAFRYGLLNAPGKPVYDRVDDAMRRLGAYLTDRNQEHLVDAANLCLMEFEEGDGHMTPVDGGFHTACKLGAGK